MAEYFKYIIQIVVLISTLVGVMARMGWKFKKNEERFAHILKEEFRDTQNEVALLRRDVNKVIIDRDFRKTLHNTIMDHVSTYIQINNGSSQSVKNILSFWGDEVDALASRWYNSEYRGVKNRKNMIKYLKSWLDGRLSIAKHFINDEIKGVKLEHDRDKCGILFAEFIVKKNLHAQFEVLIMTLAKNGYTENEEILKEFTEFIDHYFELFLALVGTWKLMKTKVYEDYS